MRISMTIFMAAILTAAGWAQSQPAEPAPAAVNPPQNELAPQAVPGPPALDSTSLDPSPADIPAQTDAPLMSVQPKTENGIEYMCGGIGAEESYYMKRVAQDYDLMLTFATSKGEYLADVDVEISDAQGAPVLSTTCDGPILLVELPHAGAYRVKAEAAGHALKKLVRVKENGRTKEVVFSWSPDLFPPDSVPDVSRAQDAGSNRRNGAMRPSAL